MKNNLLSLKQMKQTNKIKTKQNKTKLKKGTRKNLLYTHLLLIVFKGQKISKLLKLLENI